ncbi:MAG: GlyGly-CTERM sorting domain-containing protein [Gammaproteobacteria bacterium]
MSKNLSAIAVLLIVFCVSGGSAAGSQGHTQVSTRNTTPSLQWTWNNPLPNGDIFNAVAYGNGIYVAAGQDGALYTSTDGSHWSSQSSAITTSGDYEDAIYGGGKFLVAGIDACGFQHIESSSDGIHWTDTQIQLTGNQYLSLAYGGTTYIVLDGGSTDANSSNGIKWTIHNIAGFEPMGSAEYANGTFTIFGPNVRSSYFSVDNGVHWAPSATTITDYSLIPMVSNGSSFFSFGYNSVSTSTDGSHWTSTNYSPATIDGEFVNTNVLWNGTQFLTILDIDGVPTQFSSTDGITWTQGSPVSGFSNNTNWAQTSIHTILSTGQGYIAAGQTSLSVLQSSDFSTWTPAFTGATGPTIDLKDIIYAGSRYVAVGASQNGAGIVESADNGKWNSVYTDGNGTGLSTVAYGASMYAAAGSIVTAGGNSNSSPWLSSSDGVNWTPVANPPAPITSQIAYGNGVFVAFVGNCTALGFCNNVTSVTSSDGLNWASHALPSSLITAKAFENIGFIGTRFVAIGNPDSNGMDTVFSSNDGITWASSSSFKSEGIFYRIRQLSNGMVAALGYVSAPSIPPTAVVAYSQDGIAWSVTSTSLSPFSDITFDDSNYYTGLSNTISNNLMTSTDGKNWNTYSGAPLAAEISALTTNGNQMVAVGLGGDIVTATPQPPNSGGDCSSKRIGGTSGGGSSGGGSLDVYTLLLLAGLLVRRGQQWRRSAHS